MMPAYDSSSNGLPSMVACHPGTSVSRSRSVCCVLASVSSFQDAGSGWLTGTSVPDAVNDGKPPRWGVGVSVAAGGTGDPVEVLVPDPLDEHASFGSSSSVRIKDEADPVDPSNGCRFDPGAVLRDGRGTRRVRAFSRDLRPRLVVATWEHGVVQRQFIDVIEDIDVLGGGRVPACGSIARSPAPPGKSQLPSATRPRQGLQRRRWRSSARGEHPGRPRRRSCKTRNTSPTAQAIVGARLSGTTVLRATRVSTPTPASPTTVSTAAQAIPARFVDAAAAASSRPPKIQMTRSAPAARANPAPSCRPTHQPVPECAHRKVDSHRGQHCYSQHHRDNGPVPANRLQPGQPVQQVLYRLKEGDRSHDDRHRDQCDHFGSFPLQTESGDGEDDHDHAQIDSVPIGPYPIQPLMGIDHLVPLSG